MPGVTPAAMVFDQALLRGSLDTFQRSSDPVLALRLDRCFGVPAYTISPAGASGCGGLCFPAWRAVDPVPHPEPRVPEPGHRHGAERGVLQHGKLRVLPRAGSDVQRPCHVHHPATALARLTDGGQATALARTRRSVPAGIQGLGRVAARARPAGSGRRAGRADARARLPRRHLPLVQRRPAHPVVEHRSAHGAVHGRVPPAPLAAQDAAPAAAGRPLRGALRHRLRRGDPRLRRQPARRTVGHLDRAGHGAGLRRPARSGPCAQRGDLDRRRAGGRPVLRERRPGRVRRIDVHARARRFQDRARRAGGVLPRATASSASTASRTRSTWRRWAHAKSRAPTSSRPSPKAADKPAPQWRFEPVYWRELPLLPKTTSAA
jgi:hypothetical protein